MKVLGWVLPHTSKSFKNKRRSLYAIHSTILAYYKILQNATRYFKILQNTTNTFWVHPRAVKILQNTTKHVSKARLGNGRSKGGGKEEKHEEERKKRREEMRGKGRKGQEWKGT